MYSYEVCGLFMTARYSRKYDITPAIQLAAILLIQLSQFFEG
jgi:hypothetical protein